ncbi:Protein NONRESPONDING TO OXYLIPINS 2, mitochondrial [Linum grandiflorum]
MASFGAKFISRSSLSSIKSALRSNASKSAFSRSATPSSSSSSAAPSVRRFSISRMPSELGCAASMLPLHSAVATARLTSCLSTTSRSSRALSQGTLCCTSPSL